jgi:hypothetical protein
MIDSPHTWPLALGAAVLASATWAYGEIVHTRDRVGVIEKARTVEITTHHTREVELTRELTELRAENATTARILVDVLNEVRESRGKPATSFHAATESARQRAEQERGE